MTAGPGALPTGTVTFLLTDVEASTAAWQRAPEVKPAAVARLDVLLDQAITAHGGVRPVEQGEGDSVVAAFERPSDAIAAALDAQQALQAEPWPEGAALRVRMAVHTGEIVLRGEGNYGGTTLHRCARLGPAPTVGRWSCRGPPPSWCSIDSQTVLGWSIWDRTS